MRGEGGMSLLHNERVKLTASWLNTLATATATVGVLAPLASVVYGVRLGLHVAARRVLRGLKL